MKHARVSRLQMKEWFFAYLFILPTVLGLALFYFWPVIQCFVIATMRWDGMGEQAFVGMDNFIRTLKTPELSDGLSNTFRYTFTTVPITIVISVLLSCVLNSKLIRVKSIFKVIYFLPFVTMSAAVSIVWKWLFNSKYGLVNQLLGMIGIQGPTWLADPAWLMPAIVIVGIWSGIGYNMILFLAGLQGISPTYYEAAEIDGASAVKRFFYITLPFLSPTIFFASITAFIGAFKVFDIIFIFAEQPGLLLDSIKTVVFSIYRTGFVFRDMGGASAQAVILFAITLIFTGLQFLVQKKWVYYEQ